MTRIAQTTPTSVMRAVLITALIAAPLSWVTSTAQAVTGGLFFSEYVEGSSFNKYLEIYNGTGATVDLLAGAYDVQIFFNGSTSPGATIPLTGIVVDGDVYVVADAGATLFPADETSAAPFFNGDDVVVLRKGGVVIDSFGQLGFDPGSEWVGGGQNDTLRRRASVCAGDTDPNDFFDASIEWELFPQDDVTDLGVHTADCNGAGGPTDPVINEFSASTTGTDVEYVEVLGDPGTDYSAFTVLEIEGDTSTGLIDRAFSVGTTSSGGLWTTTVGSLGIENGSITLLLVEGFTGSVGDDIDLDDDGIIDFAPWTRIVDDVAVFDGGGGDLTYSSTVLGPNYDGLSSFPPGGASRIPNGTDTDAATDWVRNDFDLFGIPGFPGSPVLGEAANTPDAVNMAIDLNVDPVGACGDPSTPIHDIQGAGLVSPDVTSTREIEGVVVGDFQGTATGLGGFFVQEEVGDQDGDIQTSEGIFVFDGSFGVDVSVGDVVRVRGDVAEFSGLTELTNVTDVAVCGTGATTPAATVTLPVASLDDWERYEGMLVLLPQTLVATGSLNVGRFGEVDLAVDDRLFAPTSLDLPGSTALAIQELNDRSRILLDDGSSVQNPLPLPPYLGSDDTLRSGDTLPGLLGVLDNRFGDYRIQPTEAVIFTRANPRQAAPTAVGGTLTVAGFDVVNYFSTIDTGAPICGPAANLDCRGADSATELTRQRDKLVAAFVAMDADVVGLVSLENNANAVLDDLTGGINAVMGAGTYAYVDTGTIGTDAIKVGFIYKPATVTPVGPFAVLDSSVDPNFLDDLSKNRPSLAQTFRQNATGGTVTVVVNHLKSKGRSCDDVGDPDVGDGQEDCNVTRTLAATALVNWLATDPTGSGDPDFLVIGDLNAYAKEDPITAITGGGYTDLIGAFAAPDGYTFVFDGQAGYLDHALGNASLVSQVTGVSEWHINADEPAALDYNEEFNQPDLYSPDAFRSSNHDPVIIGLDLEVAVSVMCDVDEDGDVDLGDINLIVAARNTPATGPDDPRDADGDGVITVLDARQCVLQCTNPRCVP